MSGGWGLSPIARESAAVVRTVTDEGAHVGVEVMERRLSYSRGFAAVVAALLVVLVNAQAWAKKVICIDGAAGNKSVFLNNHEGYERALGLGGADVIQIGGNLTDCLAQLVNGDELVIIAHGAPGSFQWGGQQFTGFGNGVGQMPVPAGFNNLMNLTVRLCSCHSTAVPQGGMSLAQKLAVALGGAGNNNTITGFAGVSQAHVVYQVNGPAGKVAAATNNLTNNQAWMESAPANRPNTGGQGQPANQQTAAQAQLDARFGANVFTVTIPNAVGVVGVSAGYPAPVDAGGLAGGDGPYCDDCACAEAFAVYGGEVAAIPTVGEWALIILSLLLVTAGILFIRREVHRTVPAVA